MSTQPYDGVPDDPGCCSSPDTAPTWDFGMDSDQMDEVDQLPTDEQFVSGWRCSSCGETGDSDGN